VTLSARAILILAATMLSGCASAILVVRDDQGQPLTWQFPSQVDGRSFLAAVHAVDLARFIHERCRATGPAAADGSWWLGFGAHEALAV